MLVPPRKGLRLSASRSFAAYLSILEMGEPYVATVRIVGTAIVNRTHIDNTGKNWFDLYPPDAKEPIWAAFRKILDTPQGSLVFATEEYQRSIAIEVLTFPFADEDGIAQFVVSTTTEIDIDDLILRGENPMRTGQMMSEHKIDIGAGTA